MSHLTPEEQKILQELGEKFVALNKVGEQAEAMDAKIASVHARLQKQAVLKRNLEERLTEIEVLFIKRRRDLSGCEMRKIEEECKLIRRTLQEVATESATNERAIAELEQTQAQIRLEAHETTISEAIDLVELANTVKSRTQTQNWVWATAVEPLNWSPII